MSEKESSTKAPVEEVVPELTSKTNYRRKVWDYLEKNKLVSFPRPCYHRIPNFTNCEMAGFQVTKLDIFKSSQNIKVNPDKPQESVRYVTLKSGKNLYVPIPRLESGLLKHVLVPENIDSNSLLKYISRNGILENGKDISIDDKVKIDLVILGSVAVSKEGYRIGKGKGFADLEFAILMQMGAVNQNTIVVTTVHDSQVFDTIPKEFFKDYDVPVDIIVTPTKVIHVINRLPKPKGIIWNILSQRRVDMMPVLKLLRENDEKSGKDVTLKEVDSEPETREPPRWRSRNYCRKNRRRRQDGDSKSSENAETDDKENVKRPENRKTPNKKPQDQNVEENDKNNSKGKNLKPRPRSRKNMQKKQIDFSLIVRNIERSMRVRDMKVALNELGVKPRVLIWRGFKGYCCLHFSKNAMNTEEDGHNVDHVIGMLQNLKITPQNNKQLAIEVMKPISRIETTDVTAV